MSILVYTTMRDEMQRGTYTTAEAMDAIGNLYARKNLNDEEYAKLMDLVPELAPNNTDDVKDIFYYQLLQRVITLEEKTEAIENKMAELGMPVPKPEQPDGSKDNPVTAYKGMIYYKDKYYMDPDDNNLYLCTRDRDDKPGTGQALNYLPHELVGQYFQLME